MSAATDHSRAAAWGVLRALSGYLDARIRADGRALSTLAEGRNPASAEGDAALVRGFARGVLARWAGGEQ